MTKPLPDNTAAVTFLQKWSGNGPWVLTAIHPDRKSIDTKTFYPKEEEALLLWLNRHNGSDNLYFHVNPVMHDLSKKAEREDIDSMAWLHVDIDPRAGEDLEQERQRALGLLTERLPNDVPAPTVVVFSGGGYQGFWRLEEPYSINGEPDRYEEAKRYNMQLELDFGADNCHNVDRIMRLPGTINIPDAKKRKKGRVEALAQVVFFNENIYPLEKFKQAPRLQTGSDMLGGGGSGTGLQVKISGNIEQVQDVSELDKWDIPDRVKVIMVQGRHPDQPKQGDDSRSAWLFDFCCQMVRKNVPDDVIFAIITDGEWGIAESVVEMKGNAEKYALRQIQRAKEDAIDPWLAYFNGKYAVIKKLGGKCLVITEVYDHALERTQLVKQPLTEFEKGYENRNIKVGVDAHGNPKYKPAGTWWRKNANRRQYDRLTFLPERSVEEDVYNLWKGFAVEARAGNCELFLGHIRENICSNNEIWYNYLVGWMARVVQTPATPGEVAVVLRGGRGVGKSIFARIFGSLFGRHYMQVSNSSHLVGNFNNHLRDLVLMFADEAFYANDKKHESILKSLVTEETMAYEPKGVDVETGPNFIHLIMASNDEHVIPAGGDERRFFVLDVGEAHRQDTVYFQALVEQMDDGGREALLHHLRHIDISEYNVRIVPETAALREQKLLSLSVDEEWWFQKLYHSQLLYDEGEWPKEVMYRALVDDYIEHARRHHILRRSTETRLGKFLERILPPHRKERRMAQVEVMSGDGWTRQKTVKALFYAIPSLIECRARWERFHGNTDWPDDDAQNDLQPTEATPPF